MPDMRFAPPPSVGVKTKSGGLNQVRVRSFNERLVLQMLRQHGAISRQDLGKHSGLSAQTISVIVRALEKDGMILAGEKQRGRVGPPTIPMALNPEGAFALGVELGRTEARLAEVDFVGRIRALTPVAAKSGTFHGLIDALTEEISVSFAAMSKEHRDRLVGIGVAMQANSQPNDSDVGETIEARLSELTELPVILQNDVTCAALAEVSFGEARLLDNFIYFFLDSTVGCRMVLGGHIYSGRAMHSLTQSTMGNLTSLSQALSIQSETTEFWSHDHDWQRHLDAAETWSRSAVDELVRTIQSALGFVDANTVVIDARLPTEISQALTSRLQEKLEHRPELALDVVQGAAGENAKAIGAASLALSETYMLQDND